MQFDKNEHGLLDHLLSFPHLLSAECYVCPHGPVVERLAGPQVVTQRRLLHHRTVALNRKLEVRY